MASFDSIRVTFAPAFAAAMAAASPAALAPMIAISVFSTGRRRRSSCKKFVGWLWRCSWRAGSPDWAALGPIYGYTAGKEYFRRPVDNRFTGRTRMRRHDRWEATRSLLPKLSGCQAPPHDWHGPRLLRLQRMRCNPANDGAGGLTNSIKVQVTRLRRLLLLFGHFAPPRLQVVHGVKDSRALSFFNHAPARAGWPINLCSKTPNGSQRWPPHGGGGVRF